MTEGGGGSLGKIWCAHFLNGYGKDDDEFLTILPRLNYGDFGIQGKFLTPYSPPLSWQMHIYVHSLRVS